MTVFITTNKQHARFSNSTDMVDGTFHRGRQEEHGMVTKCITFSDQSQAERETAQTILNETSTTPVYRTLDLQVGLHQLSIFVQS